MRFFNLVVTRWRAAAKPPHAPHDFFETYCALLLYCRLLFLFAQTSLLCAKCTASIRDSLIKLPVATCSLCVDAPVRDVSVG